MSNCFTPNLGCSFAMIPVGSLTLNIRISAGEYLSVSSQFRIFDVSFKAFTKRNVLLYRKH